MGTRRESRQDLSSLVGIRSSGQEASVELRMIFRISSVVAAANFVSTGVEDERHAPDVSKIVSNVVGIVAQRFVILSLKKFRKEVARADGERAEGSDLGTFRPSKELRDFQSC